MFISPESGPGAFREWVRGWRAQHQRGGVLSLVAERDDELIAGLQATCREEQVPLLGGVFPALLLGGAFRERGALVLPFTQMPPSLLVEHLNERTPEEVAQQVEARFSSRPGESTLFLMFDALVPDIGTLLDALFRALADEYRYVGVNAGSETFQPRPCLFDAERLVGGALLAFELPHQFGAVLEHGYSVSPETTAATATRGNRVAQIDWQPALEVYRELVKRHYGVTITRENFYENAVHFPFGIVRLDGPPLVRIPVALEPDGTLQCVGEVPENALLSVLEGVKPGDFTTVERLGGQLAATSVDTVLGFYCAGRRLHLGARAADELRRWQEVLAPRQLVGALSLGEIGSARKGGYPLFHNATLVACPWPT